MKWLGIAQWGGGLVALMMGVGLTATEPGSTSPTLMLLGTSAAEFQSEWIEKGFPFIAATRYEVKLEEGTLLLEGRSEAANRSIHRELKIPNPDHAVLSWQWRVRGTLDGTVPERSKAGDDYAARVLVIFETSLVPTRIRAINYVWAARESVGEVYPSPYSKVVHNVVLQTASDAETGEKWVMEKRDLLADYHKFFGEPASILNAVAVMVDTDNTKRTATGWFKEMVLEINPAAGDSSS